jgi:hypothetical protein
MHRWITLAIIGVVAYMVWRKFGAHIQGTVTGLIK